MENKRKEYREKNKEKIKEYRKEYYLKNKQKEIEYQKSLPKKILTDEEKEKRRLYAIEYRLKNKEKVKKSRDKWKNNNRDNINFYTRNKRLTDEMFKLTSNIRTSISNIITKNGYTKKSRTHEILDCSFEEFKQHLESKFEDWMNWDNYGNPKDGIYEPNKTWDIDHIIPTNSAITEEELIELNHYTNLQPLCSYYNRVIKRGV
jgi:hypothetical protein